MLTIKLKKEVKLVDSTDELTASNWNKFQKFQLIEAGVGTDLKTIDEQYSRVAQFVDKEKKNECLQELQNIREALFMIHNQINVNHLSFACFVYSIDGEKIEDYSDENLMVILQDLSDLGLTQKVLTDSLESVKKKSTQK